MITFCPIFGIFEIFYDQCYLVLDKNVPVFGHNIESKLQFFDALRKMPIIGNLSTQNTKLVYLHHQVRFLP